MSEAEVFRKELEEIVLRFGRWMTFIEIVQYTGLALSILALMLLIGRFIKERRKT